jgi:glycosyltransferase involved in cell wall biosynthesis
MSIKKPAISILTPVWNGLPYIKECVDSVLIQQFQDWEMIISDNGSTDGTRDYLDTLIDPRIQVFKQEKNLGIDGNLNFLFSKASTEIAYSLCADDYFYSDAISRIVNEWTLVPSDTAFIGFNWKEVMKHNINAKFSYDILPKTLRPGFAQLAFFLFGNLPGNLSNVSAKVACVTDGGFDESFKMAGDFEIWARLSRKYTMVLSDTETCFVRRHEGVATKYLNKQGQLFNEHIRIYENLVEELSAHLDRQKLVDYFNIELCSYHLRDSIKAILLGSLSNIKGYLSMESQIFWPKWKRVLGCLPFALYENGRLMHINARAAGLLKEFENKPHSVRGAGMSFDASPK